MTVQAVWSKRVHRLRACGKEPWRESWLQKAKR